MTTSPSFFSKLKDSLGKETVLLGILVSIECLRAFLLIATQRVGGHDGFQYFSLQYYFLNNAVMTGEIPHWIPFMTQGTVAAWWYFIQAGIFQNALFLFAPLLKNINFIALFHIGFLVDKMILLAGVWLWAKRFFRFNLSIFFVSFAVMSSCVWMTQQWFNLKFFYAIPLIIYFVHVFLETRKWRFVFFAGNLLALQMPGNIPYFMAVISLTVFLYFLFDSLIFRERAWGQIRKIRFNGCCLLALLGVAASFFCVQYVMSAGTEWIVRYDMRGAHGVVPLKDFLTWAQNLDLKKWQELYLRVSPALDYTLYIGYLALPLVLIGLLLNFSKKILPLCLLAGVLILFSMGTFVSTFFYYTWPFMKYYRHLSLVSPLVKVLLCFLAGWGFETLLQKSFFPLKGKTRKALFVSILLVFLGLAVYNIHIAHHPEEGERVVSTILTKTGSTWLPEYSYSSLDLAKRLGQAEFMALLTLVMTFSLVLLGNRKWRPVVLAIFLAAQIMDIYIYNVQETERRTASMKHPYFYDMTRFQDMPYARRRERDIFHNNPRIEYLRHLIQRVPGIPYWTFNSFFFKDELGASFKVTLWEKPLDEYLQSYQKYFHPEENLSSDKKDVVIPSVFRHEGSLNIVGFLQDKIQFFSDSVFLDDKTLVEKNITNPHYSGGFLFLASPGVKGQASSEISIPPLKTNARLNLPYHVARFDSDHIKIQVDIPGGKDVWMLYSDVWHPFWRVKINGKEAPVYKANLAYKAVALSPGQNTVHFYFRIGPLAFLQKIIGLNALFWVGMIFWCITRRPAGSPQDSLAGQG